MTDQTTTRPPLRPLPDGAVEHSLTPKTVCGGIVDLADGTLLFAYANHAGLQPGDPSVSECRRSTNDGKTWGPPQALSCRMGIWGMIRLQSGKLAAYGDVRFGESAVYFAASPDEGRTWSEPVAIGSYPNFYTYLHSLSQASSGRLLIAGYWEGLNAGRPDEGLREGASDTLPYTQYGWGLWRGRVLPNEGHRGVEMGINLVYRSDDEGLTWTQCTGGIFGWFDEKGIPNGEGGIIDVYEPNVAETRDGRLLMIMRSKTGRLLQSYSMDQGVTWLSVLPTELAASQTTPQLAHLPQTGDLLCVWNQVSAEEIRRGFQRGRLSAAISRDNGLTWENFKTLELQEGMADVERLAPEFPIPRRLVGRAAQGQLPDGFMMFTQPNVDIAGNVVCIRYGRMWPVEKSEPPTTTPVGEWPRTWPRMEDSGATLSAEEVVLRVYPLEYFYR
jgi:sialidase-1